MQIISLDSAYYTTLVGLNGAGVMGQKSYQIGDLAQGGIVFFVDKSGLHGLVTAISDQHQQIPWGQTFELVGTRDGLGSGEANTILIFDHLEMNLPDVSQSAVSLCLTNQSVQDNTFFGGWYLPTLEELLLIDQNLHRRGLGNLAGAYWSSKESSASQAYLVSMGGTAPFALSKSSLQKVRAIRRF